MNQDVLLEAEIRQLSNGTYRVTVNGVSHEFSTLHEAYWILKEAAHQQSLKLESQKR